MQRKKHQPLAGPGNTSRHRTRPQSKPYLHSAESFSRKYVMGGRQAIRHRPPKRLRVLLRLLAWSLAAARHTPATSTETQAIAPTRSPSNVRGSLRQNTRPTTHRPLTPQRRLLLCQRHLRQLPETLRAPRGGRLLSLPSHSSHSVVLIAPKPPFRYRQSLRN